MTTQEFEHMAQILRPRLIHIGHAFFGRSAEAEDVAQETLTRLWVMHEHIDTRLGADALAIRMAKNICVNEWRKKRVRQNHKSNDIIQNNSNQTDKLEEDDNKQLLANAIATLSPTERKLFRMRHELEMELPQMAAITGMTSRSISSILSVARRKILAHIKRQGGTNI